jgi:transcriptional regulator NrdR family protein
MMKCPNCGSYAQLKVVKTEYEENGWTISVVRHYECGCGIRFVGQSWYESDGFEALSEE